MSNEPASPASAPIRISYRESAEFLMEGLSQIPPDKRFTRSIWIWAAIIAAILALSFTKKVLLHDSRDEPISWPWLIGSYGLIAALAASLLFAFHLWTRRPGAMSRRYYRELYRKQTGREESKVIAEFGEDALFVSSEGGVASHYPWSAVIRAMERSKGLFLYTGPEFFHWFPKTAFASENDYAAALRLVQAKVRDFKKLDETA